LSFSFTAKKQIEVTGARSDEYSEWVGVAYGECHLLQANLLKPDLSELSNCPNQPLIFFAAALFLEERSLVREE
jgi:hypothetical protein